MGRFKSHLKLVCYYRGISGHKKSDYRYYERDRKAGNVKPTQIEHKKEDKSPTIVVAKNDNDMLLIGQENYLNLADDDYSWIVDS